MRRAPDLVGVFMHLVPAEVERKRRLATARRGRVPTVRLLTVSGHNVIVARIRHLGVTLTASAGISQALQHVSGGTAGHAQREGGGCLGPVSPGRRLAEGW